MSEKGKHSPGKMRAVDVGGAVEIWAESRLRPVAVIERGEDDREDRANAALFAAAPQLYEALKNITEHMDRAGGDGYGMPECPWCRAQDDNEGHRGDCELTAARAALSAAAGEEV